MVLVSFLVIVSVALANWNSQDSRAHVRTPDSQTSGTIRAILSPHDEVAFSENLASHKGLVSHENLISRQVRTSRDNVVNSCNPASATNLVLGVNIDPPVNVASSVSRDMNSSPIYFSGHTSSVGFALRSEDYRIRNQKYKKVPAVDLKPQDLELIEPEPVNLEFKYFAKNRRGDNKRKASDIYDHSVSFLETSVSTASPSLSTFATTSVPYSTVVPPSTADHEKKTIFIQIGEHTTVVSGASVYELVEIDRLERATGTALTTVVAHRSTAVGLVPNFSQTSSLLGTQGSSRIAVSAGSKSGRVSLWMPAFVFFFVLLFI